MKNIFKNIKRSIAVILTLCILFGIAGTCVYAVSATPEDNTETPKENLQELMPMMASECPIKVPGIGWTGSQAWYDAIKRVQDGGHIQGWGQNGDYLSESHARMLIGAAGLSVYGGVERDDYDHNYPHIHYVLNGSRHNSIRVSE